MSLAPIWIRRGEWPAVIWPNAESARLLSAPPEDDALPPPEPKLSWFQALKNSPRSWNVSRSTILVFLIAAKSQLLKPGPSRLPEPSLPKWFTALEKELVVNQAPTVLGMCTGAIWSGRVPLVPSPTWSPLGSHGS